MARERIMAAIAYIWVIGWLVVFLAARESKLARFHLKQSAGILLFLVVSVVGWYVLAWVMALVPWLGMMLSIVAFTLVIVAFISAAVIWIIGIVNALRGRLTPLPLIGGWLK
jgi:uncharacterized membrane protein